MSSLLTVNNLSKNYLSKHGEVSAIKNISFKLKDEDFIAIVGPSGCGNAHFTLKN